MRLILMTLMAAAALTIASTSYASDLDEGKDLNGVWEHEHVSLPSLASCVEFVSWSEGQREVYMRDYFTGKYERGGRDFFRCIERYANKAAGYVTHQCLKDKARIVNVIADADRIFLIFCTKQ